MSTTEVPYASGRTNFRNWLSSQVGNLATATQVDGAVERIWPSLTSQSFMRDLFGSRERLVAAAGDDFTAGDVQRLMRSAAAKVTQEEWSDADVALLDEAESLISGSAQGSLTSSSMRPRTCPPCNFAPCDGVPPVGP